MVWPFMIGNYISENGERGWLVDDAVRCTYFVLNKLMDEWVVGWVGWVSDVHGRKAMGLNCVKKKGSITNTPQFESFSFLSELKNSIQS